MSKKSKRKKECLQAIENEIFDLMERRNHLETWNNNLKNTSDNTEVTEEDDYNKSIFNLEFNTIRVKGRSLTKDTYNKKEAIELYSKMMNDMVASCKQYQVNEYDINNDKYEYTVDEGIAYSITVNGFSLDERTNQELINKYSLNEQYKNDLKKAEFSLSVNKIKISKKSLENGILGEFETYNAIQILDDEIKILRNVLVSANDMNEEHDLIVISPKGIFTIEIKYLSIPQIQILQSGLMKYESKYYGNVVEQSRRHIHSLRRLLKTTDYSQIPISPIIVFSNDRCEIKENLSSVPSCYRNDVESMLFDNQKADVIDREAIGKIYHHLIENCQINYEKPYPLCVSPNDFYSLLGDVICIEVNKKKLLEQSEKQKATKAKRIKDIKRNTKEIDEINKKIEELEKKYTEIKEEKSNAQEILEIIDTIARSLSKY